ncbi:hypothetical protein D8I30_10815 [Brevundimonas naejangsanensis]|uniref:PIN domain-containing protein n=1 Tax=Brevundimonas naejangsanensis TaxID=588932 RepID=A0A494RQP9_9CAUL|nr:hypothetical protein [Brevundimonas naejangsanensis]AYG95616.1 hypothetical protein D8I30_10815 [Brevundimonas naejangsanensis]
MLSSTIIPMPANDKDFEEKCVVLFAGLLGDPNVKTYGARGQGQSGLDLIGRRARDPMQPVGVQCKLKTKGGRLTEKEIREETAAALTVTPHLTEYYIVTTASDDPSFDRLALELSQGQQKLGRTIDIQVFGWETLQQKIRGDQKARDAFDPGHSPAMDALLVVATETLGVGQQVKDKSDLILERIVHLTATVAPMDTARGTALEAHLDKQIDGLRDLIHAGKPRTALGLLKTLEDDLGADVGVAVRARVRANRGIAHLHLGEEAKGGKLLLEAYDINPADPKVRGNRILGLLLTGDGAAAVEFARAVVAEDPANVGAVTFLYELAGRVDGAPDPVALTPADLLDDRHVVNSRISWLRRVDAADETWRDLARSARARFGDDESIAQHYADALLGEVASTVPFARAIALADDDLARLTEVRDILTGLWDTLRQSEVVNQANSLAVACNLATALRGLNDRAGAQDIIDDALKHAPDDPDLRANAAQLALDRRDLETTLSLMEPLPESSYRTLMMLNAWSHRSDWAEVIAFATPDRRERVDEDQRQMFDTMLYRARCASNPAEIGEATTALLKAWPDRLTTRVVAADIARHADDSSAERLKEEALAMLRSDTPYPDRLMLAQLMVFDQDFDGVIAALDGKVATDAPSEPLTWLAWSFANASPRPRIHAFFTSLAAPVLETFNYARLAGEAEARRGDLSLAERHLRRALKAEPRDLRSRLTLQNVLERDGKRSEAARLIQDHPDDGVGELRDRMRMAYLLRRDGRADQALAIGYRAVVEGRDREDVVASYPSLFFMSEALPDAVAVSTVAPDVWFDLAGVGVPDVSGIVEAAPGEGRYAPDHPLVRAMEGKVVGDTVVLPSSGLGPDRTYTLREIKHKYVWLLHDVMRSHATRFPEDNSLVGMTMKDGDIEPMLEMVRKLDTQTRAVIQAYVDLKLPVSVVAAMSHVSTIEFVERLPVIDVALLTCTGAEIERREAEAAVDAAKGRGAVLDTFTAWTAHHLGVLPALKAWFGQLILPRSSLDELLEVRGKSEMNRGRESMTLSFDGDQAVREIHPADRGDKVMALIDAAVEDIRAHCEIAPNDGSDDVELDLEKIGWLRSGQIVDPLHLARSRVTLLLSDDLRLRQLSGGRAPGCRSPSRACLRPAVFRGRTSSGQWRGWRQADMTIFGSTSPCCWTCSRWTIRRPTPCSARPLNTSGAVTLKFSRTPLWSEISCRPSTQSDCRRGRARRRPVSCSPN